MKTIAALLILSVSSPAFAEETIHVVATLPDLAKIAEAVGGVRVRVTAITSGVQDPHFVDPKPSFVLKLRDADLLLVSGLDLEIDPCGPSGRWTVGTDGVGRAARVSHGPAVLRVLRGAEVLAVRAVELLPGQRMEFSIELGP